MSKSNAILSGLIDVQPRTRVRAGRPTFMLTVISFIEAFQEARRMRCAARQRCPFDCE